jgi:hypothetical protein
MGWWNFKFQLLVQQRTSLLINNVDSHDANKPVSTAQADTNTFKFCKDIRRWISSGFMG